MHPAHIQAELKIAGYTQKEVAEKLGLSQFHIHRVIHKKGPSQKVMECICKIIKRPMVEVFPEFYFRKRRRIKADSK